MHNNCKELTPPCLLLLSALSAKEAEFKLIFMKLLEGGTQAK